MEDFIHLHVHTFYSILDGQSKIKNLVDKAVADGMKGMAITDHGDMFGIKEFHDYCIGVNKNRKKDGLEPFKPIFGHFNPFSPFTLLVPSHQFRALLNHKEACAPRTHLFTPNYYLLSIIY